MLISSLRARPNCSSNGERHNLGGKFAQPTSSDPPWHPAECEPDTCPSFLLQLLPRYGSYSNWTGSSDRIPRPSPRTWSPPRTSSSWIPRPLRRPSTNYQKTASYRRLHNHQQ